jgi:hypothetical protein
LPALVKGVRMASVITTSSGFWEVLFEAVCQPNMNVSHVIESGERCGEGDRSACVHLLERSLARGDVGEHVGETLSGHCERVVNMCGVWWWQDAGWESGGRYRHR